MEVELLDIQEYALPLLDEPMPASAGKYSNRIPRHGLQQLDVLMRSSSSLRSTTMVLLRR